MLRVYRPVQCDSRRPVQWLNREPGLCHRRQHWETKSGLKKMPTYRQIRSSLNITKSAAPRYLRTGESINYTLKVCNTGSVPVNNVVVHDSLMEIRPGGTLEAGNCSEFTVQYNVTLDDLCNGSIANLAYATGNNYCGNKIRLKKMEPHHTDRVQSSLNITKAQTPRDRSDWRIHKLYHKGLQHRKRSCEQCRSS